MKTESGTSSRRILHWALGLTAFFLIVSIGATFGILRWMRKPPTAETNVSAATKPNSTAANWSRANFSTHVGEGLRQTSENSWSIKGGRAFMNVRRKDDDSLELRFVYPFDGDFLPAETIALVRTRWGLAEVEKLAEDLDITPEQIAALKAVSPATDIPVSGADKQNLRTLFEEYLAVRDAVTEKALVDAVTEIDKKYYDRTMERIDGLAESVKGIFNQDQLAALSERFAARR